MQRLFTIGAHGFDAERFFDALREAGVDLFLDLRRRRGMRGAGYSFVNVRRLQQELEARDMVYRHLIELAPDPATRELQQRRDTADRVAKRQRASLDEAFIAAYSCRTIASFDWEALCEGLHAFQRPVLFCVERAPEACHRSLVANRLAELMGSPVVDLLP
jgi:uncharacterized protein (DUF488 family)